ncbi:TetR/AcrR family transcriptional regulator [Phenylobacterium sp.]|uniref:TetR/AcrR family transcriptional regulator n=1 Tax=Phenylobacterium sp. TaxID=1871053 RepID=UPI0027315920|nr:TetR/AcrR family transcriptional regulator [Phenylobacterium sp.]MDP1875639.1 TetR/AcrR family transcriptional regulator [Phenylobacterium sp.]
MTKQRLNAEDWLRIGLQALARSGPSALRAEALARDLGTTKGSFYWHFRDLPDYLERLIRFWEDRAFEGVVARLDGDLPPRGRLEQLCLLAVGLRDPDYGGAALEPALRAWALSDKGVAEAVARMDARRIAYLKDLCHAAGLDTSTTPTMLYALYVGLETLDHDDAEGVMRAALLRV